MTTRMVLPVVVIFAMGCGSATVSRSSSERTGAGSTPRVTIEKVSAKHLPNPVRVNAKVISGGLPEGDGAFAELKELGVKTIISVDGAKPDIAIAQKYGLRYVHLPHSYDGVPEDRGKELAKAVRDLPGTICRPGANQPANRCQQSAAGHNPTAASNCESERASRTCLAL